jgi:hypothetical protein
VLDHEIAGGLLRLPIARCAGRRQPVEDDGRNDVVTGLSHNTRFTGAFYASLVVCAATEVHVSLLAYPTVASRGEDDRV